MPHGTRLMNVLATDTVPALRESPLKLSPLSALLGESG